MWRMIRIARNPVRPASCDTFLCVLVMNEAVTSKEMTLKSAIKLSAGPGSAIGDDEALQGLLAGYVSGTLSPAARALVASYAEFNPEIAAIIEAMEVACGDSLMSIEPMPLSNSETMLEEILAMGQENIAETQAETSTGSSTDAPTVSGDAILLPEPLREFLGLTDGDVPWKRSLAGFHELRVDGADEDSVRLLKLKAGQKMPDHGHHGLELTLVVSGAFSDSTGHYRRGSVQIADEHLDHQPIVDADSDCICFTVVEAPLRFRSPLTRMVAPLLDR